MKYIILAGFEGGQMPLHLRLLKRGFTNIFATRYAIVNVADLNRFEDDTVVGIEELCASLKERYTIVIVTHNMQQATRISDRTAFFLLGELIECNETENLFSVPKDKRTEDYITGRFG